MREGEEEEVSQRRQRGVRWESKGSRRIRNEETGGGMGMKRSTGMLNVCVCVCVCERETVTVVRKCVTKNGKESK